MGLLARLRSLEPAHRTAELLRALEKPRPLRTALYLNEEKIENAFAETFGGLLTANRGGSRAGKISLGAPMGAGGELGSDHVLQETIGSPP